MSIRLGYVRPRYPANLRCLQTLPTSGERGIDLTLHVLLRIADDLFLPYTFDLSIFRDIADPDLTEHIRRVGVTMYEKPTP